MRRSEELWSAVPRAKSPLIGVGGAFPDCQKHSHDGFRLRFIHVRAPFGVLVNTRFIVSCGACIFDQDALRVQALLAARNQGPILSPSANGLARIVSDKL